MRIKPHEKSSKKVLDDFTKNGKIANKLRKKGKKLDINLQDYM